MEWRGGVLGARLKARAWHYECTIVSVGVPLAQWAGQVLPGAARCCQVGWRGGGVRGMLRGERGVEGS